MNKLAVLTYFQKNKLLILLEGLISGGKSSLCKSINFYLNKYIKVRHYPEPINEKLLNLFYSDIKKHAFSFQSIVIRERVHVLSAAEDFLSKDEGDLSAVDRSEIGDCAFALMHYNSGNISDEQFEVYGDLTKPFLDCVELNNIKKVKKCVVYLTCTPKKARERVIKRGNPKEMESCTEKYLEELEKSYMKVMGYGDINEKESLVIDQIFFSLNIHRDDIIYINYEEDFEIIDGMLTENDTFNILRQIISNFQ